MYDPKQIFNLNGRVAIITGASKGIGAEIAHYLSANGALVIISSRNQSELDTKAREINLATGNEVIGIAANAGNAKDLNYLVKTVQENFGRIDILVNNAATNPVFGPSIECSDESLSKILEVNVEGVFKLSKLVYPLMKSLGEGTIINIGSISGINPEEGLGMYSVSKAALNMLTKVLAKEWGKDGIRVNAICPGLIKTKFSEPLWKDSKILQSFTDHLPISRIGNASEVASLALFLASEASSYCTGGIFPVDGGATL